MHFRTCLGYLKILKKNKTVCFLRVTTYKVLQMTPHIYEILKKN